MEVFSPTAPAALSLLSAALPTEPDRSCDAFLFAGAARPVPAMGEAFVATERVDDRAPSSMAAAAAALPEGLAVKAADAPEERSTPASSPPS